MPAYKHRYLGSLLRLFGVCDLPWKETRWPCKLLLYLPPPASWTADRIELGVPVLHLEKPSRSCTWKEAFPPPLWNHKIDWGSQGEESLAGAAPSPDWRQRCVTWKADLPFPCEALHAVPKTSHSLRVTCRSFVPRRCSFPRSPCSQGEEPAFLVTDLASSSREGSSNCGLQRSERATGWLNPSTTNARYPSPPELRSETQFYAKAKAIQSMSPITK